MKSLLEDSRVSLVDRVVALRGQPCCIHQHSPYQQRDSVVAIGYIGCLFTGALFLHGMLSPSSSSYLREECLASALLFDSS